MRKILVALALLSANVVARPALAQSFEQMGYGTESCGSWSADRESSNAFSDESWVLGFITASNASYMLIKKQTVTVDTDSDGVFAWIDDYCSRNPTSSLTGATMEFWSSSGTIQTGN